MPSARFISGCYSERLSLDHSRKSRDVVLSDKYRALFPDIKLRHDQDTKGYFANTLGGMRFATGVGGSVTGMHAHFIDIDDPLDPLGALSDLTIAEANNWIIETLGDRKVDKMLTPTAMVMQRVHQNDPTGMWLERGGRIRHICWPADTTWEVKPESFKEFYSAEGLLDSRRLPREVLEEAQSRGESYYAGQYGQSPIPRGGAMFKVDRLHYASIPPSHWKRGPFRFWDKAGTKGGGAFTAGIKGAIDFEDRLWILDMQRGQWDSGTRERIILDTAKLDGRKCRVGVEQEPGAAGKESAENTARNLTLSGFRCVCDKATGDKETRADPFSVYVNIGKVVILTAPWNRVFVEEMRFFPVSTYKDQIDAGSGMFANLVKRRIKVGALR